MYIYMGLFLGIQFCSIRLCAFFLSQYHAVDFVNFLKKIFIYLFIFRERGREEKEREKNINMWLLLIYPPPGTWSVTQACALTGDRTSNPLVLQPALNLLSHTSQVSIVELFEVRKYSTSSFSFLPSY